mmetsp:Transcript_84563/g.235913  ORF Transcript_84563/g.235913 Transcript_84563/m.235913 type:complete len:322 (+) Transcript_84563:1132-2097(+)
MPAIRCWAVSSPRHRCNATTTSVSICPSCATLRSSACTAEAFPSCTQTHSGNRLCAFPRTTGEIRSSTWCRREGSEMVFTSSRRSGVNFTTPWQMEATAGMFRCCRANDSGVLASSDSILTSARAPINSLMPSCTDSALPEQFIANNASPERPLRPFAASDSSRAFGSAPSAKVSRTSATSTSRSSSHACRNSEMRRVVAARSWSLLNASSPTCSRMRASICERLSESEAHRCKAMTTSAFTSSSWAAFLSRASIAGTQPTCTQTHKGSLMVGSLWMGGSSNASNWRRFPSCEIPFTSSSTSGVTRAPCSQKAAAAAMLWC